MSIFDKFQSLAAARRRLLESGANPFNFPIGQMLSATEALIDGRRTILLGTNNYLGLSRDPDCVEAACRALRDYGTGTTGSRLANGTSAAHLALERELAEFYECRHCIVFSTGYQANLGTLAALAGADDVILLDADSHASLYDGCRLGSAEVIRFRHNDPADLEKRLRRLGARAANTLILVEGIYSMLGDRAPLAAVAALKREYGAWLLVDEAHGLGVLGEHGRGLIEEAGVAAEVDFVVGTFSKSLGATGGFCVSNHPELEVMRYASRPYVFTASPSPATIASVRAALAALRTRPALRERLWANARRLYDGLRDLGFELGPEPSPLVAVLLGEREQALAVWSGLLERGVYVNLVLPPATPTGICLLRTSVSAAHTPEQLDRVLEAFAAVREAVLTAPAG